MSFFRELMWAMQADGHEVGILTGHHIDTRDRDIELMLARGFPAPDFYIGRPVGSQEHGGTFKPRMIREHRIDHHFDDCDYRNLSTVALMGTHPQVFQCHPREPRNAHREDWKDTSGDARALEQERKKHVAEREPAMELRQIRAGIKDRKDKHIRTFTPAWSQHPFMMVELSAHHVDTLALTWHLGQDEKENHAFAQREDYDLFVDIGASVGYFSCRIAAARPDVVVRAFEADPLRYGILYENLAYYPNATALHGMVGDYPLNFAPDARFCDPLLTRGCPVKRHYTNFHSVVPVSGDQTALVKVDIEGGESPVFELFKEQVNDPRIKWMIEHHGARTNHPVEWFTELFSDREVELEECGDRTMIRVR